MTSPRLILTGIAAVLTMSAVPVLVKSSVSNEITIGISRLAIAAMIFTPIILWRGRLAGIRLVQWRQLLVIGVVFGFHWLTFFASIKLATAAIAALTILTYSVQYLILAWIFNGERVTPPEWLAIAVCFAGCVVVAPEFSLDNDIFLGIVVGLLSALLYAVMPLLHQRASDIGTVERTWGQFSFAMLVFLPFWPHSEWGFDRVELYRLLVLGILCTVVAHGLWVKASTELPAIYASMIYYLYLPGALVGSAVFLGEAVTPTKLAGCAMVLGASSALSLHRYRLSRLARDSVTVTQGAR